MKANSFKNIPRLGSESFKTKMLTVSPNQNPQWMETASLIIPDVTHCPDLDIKVKDSKSRELGRASVSVSSFQREQTHESWIPLSEDRSVLILFAVTGTNPDLTFGPRRKTMPPAPNLFEEHLGKIEILVKRAEGLPKLSGVGNVFCSLELDDSKLETQALPRTSNPSWEKSFNFTIKVFS